MSLHIVDGIGTTLIARLLKQYGLDAHHVRWVSIARGDLLLSCVETEYRIRVNVFDVGDWNIQRVHMLRVVLYVHRVRAL